ncbi:hypothetical protein [Frigoribacterium salinisoli]
MSGSRLAALLGTLAVLASVVGGASLLLGGDPSSPAAVVAWAVVGVVIAGVLLVTAWRTPSVRVPEVVIEFALVLVGGGPALAVAASVSGTAWTGVAPSVVSLAAAVVALATAVGATVARRRAASATRASEGPTP